MEVVHPRCCGIDLHKKDVKATLMISGSDGKLRQETRTFATMTDDLL